jgi:hypothetical protein
MPRIACGSEANIFFRQLLPDALPSAPSIFEKPDYNRLQLKRMIKYLLLCTNGANCSIHINTHTLLELGLLTTVEAAAGGAAPPAERAARYSSTALRKVRFCLRRVCRSGRFVRGDLLLVNSHCVMCDRSYLEQVSIEAQ